MDPLRFLAESQGFFTRTDAFQLGFDDKSIARALRARRWTRIRQGAYTFTDLWQTLDKVGRHVVTAHAVAKRLGSRVALSHLSAALHHGLTVWDADLGTVHVTRTDGCAGRTEAGVQHHEGVCLESDLVEKDGYLTTSPARAALEAASLLSAEAAVVLLDDGLHNQLFTRTELDEAFSYMSHWPSSLHLQVAVPFADGRAESVGESRARYLCYAYGLPAPELQFEVYDEHGSLVGITDMAWEEERLLGEFDGRVKYSRLLRPGETAGDAVFREKRREDALRRVTGFSMVRLVWSDLGRGADTAAMIRAAMRRGPDFPR